MYQIGTRMQTVGLFQCILSRTADGRSLNRSVFSSRLGKRILEQHCRQERVQCKLGTRAPASPALQITLIPPMYFDTISHAARAYKFVRLVQYEFQEPPNS